MNKNTAIFSLVGIRRVVKVDGKDSKSLTVNGLDENIFVR